MKENAHWLLLAAVVLGIVQALVPSLAAITILTTVIVLLGFLAGWFMDMGMSHDFFLLTLVIGVAGGSLGMFGLGIGAYLGALVTGGLYGVGAAAAAMVLRKYLSWAGMNM